MSQSSDNKKREQISFEITTTNKCNFSCDYCFEKDERFINKKNIIFERSDEVIEKIKNIFNSNFISRKFFRKEITFWGGEPCLNKKFIEKIIYSFYDDESVFFFIYTNGSLIHKFIDILKDEKLKNRITVQISYDGVPIHKLRRRFKNDKDSTELILNNINFLKNEGLKLKLKATLKFEDFKYLPDVWDDFKKLYDKYELKYSPTVDYHNVEFYKYRNDVEENLLKIAKKEIEFHKENGEFLSNLFLDRRAFCSTGRTLTIIDLDGNMYYCHGCLYTNNIGPFTSIFNDESDIIKKLQLNYFVNFKDYDKQPQECLDCIALTCLKCNVVKVDNSKKEKFIDKWFDFTSQKELCDYYKLVGKIGRAIYNIL